MRISEKISTIVLASIPILVFMLLPVYSDSKLDEESKNFGSQVIDDEDKLLSTDPIPLDISEENDDPSVDQRSNEEIFPLEKNQKEKIVSKESKENLKNNSGPSNMDELTTVLNVTDADIEALVKTFSKLTGRNYIVDSSVKGKVTIHLPTPITISEALKVFDSVLLLRGFATVPVSNNIWKVISAKDAKQTTIPHIDSDNITDESLVTEIIKSTHLNSDELQKIISQFVSRDGFSQAVSGTNLIILVDTTSNIRRIRSLISELDIPPVDQDITIIPIEHALADDIADKINKIMGDDEESEESDGGLSLPRSRRAAVRSAIARARGEKSSDSDSGSSAVRSKPTKIIPDERTNSLIVLADELSTLKVKALVQQLDSEMDRSSGRFWVYSLEHGNAEELAIVLNNLISGNGGVSGGSTGGFGSSMSRNQNSSSGFGGGGGSGFGGAGGLGGGGFGNSSGGGRNRSRGGIQRQQTGGSSMMAGSGGGSMNTPVMGGGAINSSRVKFQDQISISADLSTNSLLINADKSDYEKLLQVIKVLDVQRKQVLVEATILEVSLAEDFGVGVELQGTGATNSSGVFGQTNFGDLTNLLTNPARLSDLTIAAASSGTLTLPGGIQIPTQAAIVSAVSAHSNVNVLSSPTILSTDNQEAEIIVGENVPFVTGTGTNQVNLGNTFNQIQRQDVGITLRITPQIGSGDYLNLHIFVEISSVVPGTRNDPNGPTTTIRTSDTVVAVKNRQMVVTGGLIQDSVNQATRGVPFFQEIPVLGNLFKSEDELKDRTNLLIFLTPQIIEDRYDARDQTKIRAQRMESDIRKNEVIPSRSETLNNPAIDDVFEEPEEEDHFDNRPISPKLEETKKNNSKLYSFSVMKDKSDSLDPELPDNNTYVVLKPLNSNENNITKGLISAERPEDQTTFEIGSKYDMDNKSYVCIGLYESKNQAESMHNDINKWTKLSEQKLSLLKNK